MARWRVSDERPVMPERLTRFVAAEWVDFDEPFEPRQVGAQVPTLSVSPPGVVPESWPTEPPDPHSEHVWFRPPRSTWVDAEGRWWRDDRVVDARELFIAARRQWCRDNNIDVASELAARRVQRVASRRRGPLIHIIYPQPDPGGHHHEHPNH